MIITARSIIEKYKYVNIINCNYAVIFILFDIRYSCCLIEIRSTKEKLCHNDSKSKITDIKKLMDQRSINIDKLMHKITNFQL